MSGACESAQATITLASLDRADGVLLVTDSTQELTEPELMFLRRAAQRCDAAACVMTKTDISPAAGRLLDRNRRHLDEHDMAGVPIVSVSSTLHLRALAHRDPALEEESGFAALFGLLHDHIFEPASERAAAGANREVLDATEQLLIGIDAMDEIRNHPERTDVVVGSLEMARNRMTRFRSESARWQTTLNDGIGDLIADSDHDFRERVRRVTRKIDTVVDQEEQIDLIEQQLQAWLSRETAEEVLAYYDFLRDRAAEIVTRVAGHFRIDESAGDVAVDFSVPSADIADVRVTEGRSMAQRGGVRRTITAVQGLTGGAVMASTAGSLAGIVAISPLVAVIPIAILPVAALMSRKAFREDRERQDHIRRQELKTHARKYVDEVAFVVGKHSKDRLRVTQRQMRDHFTDRVTQLERSLADAVEMADGARRAMATGAPAVAPSPEASAQLRQLRDRAARGMAVRPVAAAPDPVA